MKNTSRKQENTRSRRAAAAAAEPEPIATPAADAEVSRVSFAVATDGKPIDPERLRAATKDRLRIAFQDEEFLKAIGVRSDSAVDEENAFLNSIIADGALDLASVAMLTIARRAGYAIEHARVLAFTPPEKAQLRPAVAAVVQKYMPSISGKYREEIVLALALTNVIAAKIALLRETAARAAQVASGSTVAPPTATAPDTNTEHAAA